MIDDEMFPFLSQQATRIADASLIRPPQSAFSAILSARAERRPQLSDQDRSLGPSSTTDHRYTEYPGDRGISYGSMNANK
jgi:hypothetical protein